MFKKQKIDHEAHSNLCTRPFYQTKSSFEPGVAHARNVEQADVKANDLIQDLQHVRYSRLGEGKDMSTPERCGKHSKEKSTMATLAMRHTNFSIKERLG